MVLETTKNWIAQRNLFGLNEKVLCGVSGGKDSIALCLILKKLGYQIAIAHVNFELRGEESDEDARFTEAFSSALQIPFHTIHFNTKALLQPGESIQLAARRLRYEWFEQLCLQHGYHKIATAHSANDNAETILYNLSKGTGLRGLLGIPPQNGKVVRPILCLDTQEILQFLENENQSYRTDSSNLSDKYARNNIRHHVIPPLQSINPSLVHTFFKHSERLRNINAFYQKALKKEMQNRWKWDGRGWWTFSIAQIENNDLNELAAENNLIFESLLLAGFSEQAIADVLNGNHGSESKTEKYRLIKDRNHLLLSQQIAPQSIEFKIDSSHDGALETDLGTLTWCRNQAYNEHDLKNPENCLVDLDKVNEPIRLKNVHIGDKMQPFGMKGQALLTDMMTNKKWNSLQKEQALALYSGSQILWWVAERTSQRFCIKEQTRQHLFFHWKARPVTPFYWF